MIQTALNVFKLPYTVTDIVDYNNYVLYRIKAETSQATLNRLQSRLEDIKEYTGKDISIVRDRGIALRVEKENKQIYLYENYNGYTETSIYDLPYMVGLTPNEFLVDDLTKAPHLLVAGTTGSGKSNYLHTVLQSLMANPKLTNSLDCYLIDCKRVEFSVYQEHAAIADDLDGAYKFTAYICYKMDERYKDMQSLGVRDFKEYKKLRPDENYIILVVDELADLISNKDAKKIIIPRLLRIAQIGRASGVHLIISTQRPDHTVINVTLKGNIPTRIAFNCASRFDSQVILDRPGAEKLTGNGDGLFLRNGSRDLIRFQSPYISLDYIRTH